MSSRADRLLIARTAAELSGCPAIWASSNIRPLSDTMLAGW